MHSGANPVDNGWEGDGWLARWYLWYARKVPPHPSKIRLFRWLGALLFPRGMPVTGYGGVRLAIDPLDYIGHEICFSRAYEPLSIALARRLMAGGGTFLDVGANFGLYTCPVAQLPGVECVAVDASAIAFAKLQDNLARNPASAVQAVNVALAATHGLVALETPVPGNLGTTRVSSAPRGARQRAHVGAMPLEALLDALAVTHVRLMKIDVEGFEAQVFRGMELDSPRSPEHIIMEYSRNLDSRWHDLKGCMALLERHGYVARSVTGEAFDPGRAPPEENVWWSRA